MESKLKMKKLKKLTLEITKFFLCTILKDHEWTSKSLQGIQPTKEELSSGIDGFNKYAEMYCERCNKKSRLFV